MFIKEEPGAFARGTTGESSIKGSLEVFNNNPSFSDEHVTNGEDKVGADVLQDTNASDIFVARRDSASSAYLGSARCTGSKGSKLSRGATLAD